MVETSLLRWIVLLPGLAAAVHGVMLALVRREAPRGFVVALSCGSVVLSFALSCVALLTLVGLPAGERLLHDDIFTWIGAGRFSAELAFQVDALSAVMILVVTGVGSLIHVYSVGYMADDHRDDRGFQRFFCYLNLFTFAMLLLVLGDNLLVLFLGWEGVGLCSYLLIGFWYSDRWNAYCGTKAFVVNRIGDFGFLIGMLLLVWALIDQGSVGLGFRELESSFGAIAERTVPLPSWLSFLPGAPEWRLVTVIGLCLFIGAAGKSAQIPLYVWLPDAMAGPTPVSALIHAATMVTAGVYMVCRLGFLYAASPVASAVVAWTGGLTALLAATIAIAQTDIKKVLAYSTVSQLGYMFLAAGCGGYGAAIFHLGTHAFFKALLFLGSGAVILSMHHEQDTDHMGGLRGPLRRTHFVFAIGVIAIAGIPPLSGFFSKDEVLLSAWLAHDVPGHTALWALAVGTAALTAFYMFRLHFRTFWGECRAPAEVRAHLADQGPVVLMPLYVLAFFSVVAGLAGLPQVYGDVVGIPHSNSLANFLGPVLAHGEGGAHHIAHSTELALAAVAVAAAGLGIALAWWLYVRRPELPARLRAALGGLHRWVRDKYYVDEIYDATIVRPLVQTSDRLLFRVVDAGLIDGLTVNGSARAVRALAARGLKYAHSGFTQGYLFVMLLGTLLIVGWLVG